MEHQDNKQEDGKGINLAHAGGGVATKDGTIKDGAKHSSFRAHLDPALLKVALAISGNGLEKQVVGVIVPLFY